MKYFTAVLVLLVLTLAHTSQASCPNGKRVCGKGANAKCCKSNQYCSGWFRECRAKYWEKNANDVDDDALGSQAVCPNGKPVCRAGPTPQCCQTGQWCSGFFKGCKTLLGGAFNDADDDALGSQAVCPNGKPVCRAGRNPQCCQTGQWCSGFFKGCKTL
eukprot:Stramenopile-MAST_4_protein_2325